MGAFNGKLLRTLINGEEIRSERRVSFEPSDIRVTLLAWAGDDTYNRWKARKGEKVNFKVTETDIDLEVTITNVILKYETDEAVEIELRLS